MSIWEEMIKYNLFNKRMYVDSVAGNLNNISVTCNSNSLNESYKKVAKFAPSLNGNVSLSISVEKNTSSGSINIDTTYYQIIDENGNVLYQITSDRNYVQGENIELTAGVTYYLQCKIGITPGNTRLYNVYYMPKSMNLSYNIADVSNHIIAEAVNE